ncbi:nucleotide sugar dehydrogenase [Saccharopolyspora sp. WRP15-2]|uniref:Nucleotide sugar dehydrogenase n=1 Tax=Saccharopolyspora oryzae TaxID=2997343 RepID=A0ABT4UYU2_9PSEU|nr:nucleotide sugar dehydrogenase [Saccharopolyspora oryzae]MDA3626855.1 nucleotide sugar dehydrogenase [Saccharopolyspora oryzae]
MNRADVVVVGLGFVGVPLATAAARAGFRVCGVDATAEKLAQIEKSVERRTAAPELQAVLDAGRLELRRRGELPDADVYCLSVPTPMRADGSVDTSQLRDAAESVGKSMRKGALVLVHSTCAPGSLEEQIIPHIARKSRLLPGIDFHIAHAPERIDPARDVAATGLPRVVAGLTPQCTKAAAAFLRSIFDQVIPVSSIRTAEFVKTFENTFRLVNISLANELAEVCRGHDVDPVEIIEAAATKPYGFLPHRPGIGAGGGCIPVVTEFFRTSARQRGIIPPMVEAALAVNAAMPGRTVELIRDRLAQSWKLPLNRCRVLVVGITYKPDVIDIRNSCAIRVIDRLSAEAAGVDYYDPGIPLLRLGRGRMLRSTARLDATGFDVAVILTKHTSLDYSALRTGKLPVLDCSSGTPVPWEDHA